MWEVGVCEGGGQDGMCEFWDWSDARHICLSRRGNPLEKIWVHSFLPSQADLEGLGSHVQH